MAILEAETLDGRPHRLKVSKTTKALSELEALRRIDLTNLTVAENLATLRLSYQGRVALDPLVLARLPALRVLDVGVSEVPDLSLWPDCPLTELALTTDAGPVDLAKVRSCKHLVKLDLSTSTRSLDLRPLAELPIERLSLAIRNVASVDWSALGQLPRLTELGITLPTGVEVDLSGLGRLRRLRLSMGDYRTLDLSPLKGRALEVLDVFGNNALVEVGIHHLANPALQAVIVKSKGLKDASVAGFEVATGLRNLDLGSTSLVSLDLRPIERLKQINSISVPVGCQLRYDPLLSLEELKKASVGLWNLLKDELI